MNILIYKARIKNNLFLLFFVFLSASSGMFAQISATNDVYHATKNQTLTLDVLTNDRTAGGIADLDKVVLINNGTASIENNRIKFVPKTDFIGIALLNYTLCNRATPRECDCGLVTIDISETPMLPAQEMHLFTTINKPVSFTLPRSFELISGSSIQNAGDGLWKYIPVRGFSGLDVARFRAEEDGEFKYYEVRVDVLQTLPRPDFTKPDYATCYLY
jgi:hypothetical protein